MKIYSRILSTGSYLPKKFITNKDLEKILDTSDEWIVQRTGIRGRYVVSENESAATMAVEACKKALESANLNAKDIDMVIGATCSSDQIFPSIACTVQKELNIPIVPAFDLQAACSGFIYALSVADQYIKSGICNKVLVVGSEAMSRTVDWEDRATCVLFGDGAGAVILEKSETPGILSTHLKADGRYSELLFLNNAKHFEDAFLKMQGNSVFRLAVKYLEEIVIDTLDAMQIESSMIDWLVPHQANIRIIQATAKKLNMSMDKVILTVENHANTSAASIPLALDVAVKDGRIKRGQTLLLEAFGAGLTWGSALIRY